MTPSSYYLCLCFDLTSGFHLLELCDSISDVRSSVCCCFGDKWRSRDDLKEKFGKDLCPSTSISREGFSFFVSNGFARVQTSVEKVQMSSE